MQKGNRSVFAEALAEHTYAMKANAEREKRRQESIKRRNEIDRRNVNTHVFEHEKHIKLLREKLWEAEASDFDKIAIYKAMQEEHQREIDRLEANL